MQGSRDLRQSGRQIDVADVSAQTFRTHGELLEFLDHCLHRNQETLPRCGRGRLFAGFMRVNEKCANCEMNLEPGLGYDIGAFDPNDAATIILVITGYWFSVFAWAIPQTYALWEAPWGSLAFVALFPVWFYTYARSLWLTLMYNIRPNEFDEQQHDGSKTENRPPQENKQQEKWPCGTVKKGLGFSQLGAEKKPGPYQTISRHT